MTTDNDNMKTVVEYIANNTKTWLELLGYPQYNETVDGNDIVREVDLHKFKILWSFENHAQAKESLKSWYNEWEDFCENKDNYK